MELYQVFIIITIILLLILLITIKYIYNNKCKKINNDNLRDKLNKYNIV